jgi:hypothetical protein
MLSGRLERLAPCLFVAGSQGAKPYDSRRHVM